MPRLLRLPIFRAFTHPKLENVGLKDGRATAKDIADMSAVTNILINKKLHVPPLRQTHSGSPDGTSRGWVTGTEAEGGTLFGLCAFTEHAQSQVKDGELRWFSSGLRRDFSMTGEPTGLKLPGIYVDHVALLGSEHPQVKGLIDLSTVEFAEGEEVPMPDTVFIQFNEATGEVSYFAEMKDQSEEDNEMDPKDKDQGAIALFMEKMEAQSQRLDKMSADLTAANERATKAEAQLAEVAKSGEAAKFAEFETKVITPALEAATKALKLGADAQKAWKTIAARVYGDRDAEAAFSEVIKTLQPVVPGKRMDAPAKGDNTNADLSEDAKGPGSAEFGEGNAELTVAHFNEANGDPKVAQKIYKVLQFERAKRKLAKPEEFTTAHLRAEVAARG